MSVCHNLAHLDSIIASQLAELEERKTTGVWKQYQGKEMDRAGRI